MLIGLTGQIGAGKSTVARILAALGAVIIDADRIGRQVVEESQTLLDQLRSEFGPSIVDEWGQLRRERLAELAFVSDESKVRLNELVHPHLLNELRRQIRQAVSESGLIVVDAALLLDWNLDKEMDQTWVVEASEEVRMQRLTARGMTPEDALARQRAQLPLGELRKRADRILENNRSLDELRMTVRQLLEEV